MGYRTQVEGEHSTFIFIIPLNLEKKKNYFLKQKQNKPECRSYWTLNYCPMQPIFIFITQYFSVAIRCVCEVADLLNIRGKKHYGDIRGQS